MRHLEGDIGYWKMKRDTKAAVMSTPGTGGGGGALKGAALRDAVRRIMDERGMFDKLRSMVYSAAQEAERGGARTGDSAIDDTAPAVLQPWPAAAAAAAMVGPPVVDGGWPLDAVPGKTTADNTIDAITGARRNWERRVAERMNAAARNGVPWNRVRVSQESLPKTLPPCYGACASSSDCPVASPYCSCCPRPGRPQAKNDTTRHPCVVLAQRTTSCSMPFARFAALITSGATRARWSGVASTFSCAGKVGPSSCLYVGTGFTIPACGGHVSYSELSELRQKFATLHPR
jgi:hypothetical protein